MGTLRIGIDIGGTFTDVVLMSPAGVRTSKAPTTPWDFSVGVLDGLHQAASDLGTDLPGLLRRTDLLNHGSTVATNALITRSGATVGLITTRGFEDTPLVMRAVGRVDGLSEEEIRRVTAVTKPDPLVPPERIRGVRERVDAFGEIAVPLAEADVAAALDELLDGEGVDALAVSLLHAWRNPVHERRIRELVAERRPDRRVYVSLGSDLSQVAGEYARTNTAIANAFVGPAVGRYLENLERQLRDCGFEGRILVMQGNGGLTSHDRAAPISTLQSGPAGGMLASAELAKRLGHRSVVTADMGGTSFDVGIIDEGYWRYADEPIFERFRILQPITDITSIGAGGGTIARIDPASGRLLVGPSSAGSVPGPACYGAGGTEPTVTDADLVLGYLDPERFLGGRRPLDVGLARRAIQTRVGEALGIDPAEAAAGIVRSVDNKMSDLIRREVIRSGRRPEELVLYAFGGASPVHAVGYARELGVREIVVFPTSPVFSAFGIATADIVHTRLATRSYALPVDPAILNADLESLESELLDELDRTVLSGEPEMRRYVTLRFRRQTTGEEMALPWDRFTPERLTELEQLFVDHYESLYGEGVAYLEAGLDLAGFRIDLVGPVPKPELRPEAGDAGAGDLLPARRREVWFDGGFVDTPIHELPALPVGAALDGPAIVDASFTTVVLPPGAHLTVDPYRNLVIRP
jgi:N-methylhydantoinase A